ncbi:hypothetical protein IWX49DRAFT_572087 [Phyllosticta citricarpa]|uniref:ubiquitinyl hydrolase 1 n=2 Tax=Phyllosticta TaxID=121621 RepID=A0ABR1LGG6_9PEZI
MAFTKIKTKDLARSATLKRSRRRRIVFLSTSSNSRFFDERTGRYPHSKNKGPLSSAAAAEPPQVATTATMAAKSTSISSAPEPQHHPKSKNQKTRNLPTPKKIRPEISLIKKKEQEASSETSESSSNSSTTSPPSIFDRDEANGKTGPVVDTPPSSPASEIAPDSETKKKTQKLTKQEKREAKKQASSLQQQQQQQQQQSKTSNPSDAKQKTKVPVEQASSDRTQKYSKKGLPKPQASSRKDQIKESKTAGQSRPGKKNEMATSKQRQQFLDSLDRRWPNLDVGGHGLLNPGNLCYRRAVLQCLLNIPVFVNWLNEHHATGSPNQCPGISRKMVEGKPKEERARGCLACALLQLARAYWTPGSKTQLLDATRYFDQTMSNIAMTTSVFPAGNDKGNREDRLYQITSQQDSGEFFRWIFDTLEQHNQMRKVEIDSIFGHVFCWERKCPGCGHDIPSATNVSTQWTLSIGDKPSSLERCIAGDLKPQALPECLCENKDCAYYEKQRPDEKGNKKRVDMTRRMTGLTQCPEILFIQLNRTGRRGKHRHVITYPPVLDLSRYLHSQNTETSARYSLSGVVLHRGDTIRSGHYWAHAVTPQGVRELNDSYVGSRTLNDLLAPKLLTRGASNTPVLLFYTRLRDGEESPLAQHGSLKPRPTGTQTGKATSSSHQGGNNTDNNDDNAGSLRRSDSGFQKKRKFSDAHQHSHSHSPGFKKHKQNNRRSTKF